MLAILVAALIVLVSVFVLIDILVLVIHSQSLLFLCAYPQV